MGSVAYLDSSAIVKLVVAEAESPALHRYLQEHPVRVGSALSHVEVIRAVRSQGAAAVERARRVLARIALLRLDSPLLDAAAAIGPDVLRSLDAIHLASARLLGEDLAAVVTYDRRMTAAARVLELPTAAPV